MEAFFMGIAQDSDMPGYEEFEKQAWGFKVRGEVPQLGLNLELWIARSPQC